LRHNSFTLVGKHHGLDAAKPVLGQRTISAAEIYAERDLEQAERVAAELG